MKTIYLTDTNIVAWTQFPASPPTISFTAPRSRFKLKDERKTRGLRLNLSLRGYDWTVKNPVPTFESVFGVEAPSMNIKLPRFL